jgi:hypothetical protein
MQRLLGYHLLENLKRRCWLICSLVALLLVEYRIDVADILTTSCPAAYTLLIIS